MSTVTARPLTGPPAWPGEDLARARDWIRPCSPAEIAELDGALRAVERRGLAGRDITREDFPIPGVAATLAAVSHELEHGRGLVLLRGFPFQRYGEDELKQIYWGIGVHLGTPRYQNAHGELMPNSRPLPPGFEVLWGSIEPGALRGGIAQPGIG